MPKRCRRDRVVGPAKPRRQRQRQHHLYLVLDDLQWGYSIRRVDLPSSDDTSSDSDDRLTAVSVSGVFRRRSAAEELRLPPAVFRLEAPPDHPDYFAAAFGTKIVAMSPPDVTRPSPPICGAVPLFDVRTRLLGFAPRPEPEVNLEQPIFFSFDDERLFVVSASSFKMLRSIPVPRGEEDPPCWEWCELPKHPFNRSHATSYGAHPDGIIFVSTNTATFTFDTSSKLPHTSSEWKRHSEGTTLPFTGRAYFDSELDTWVGLYRGDDDHPEAVGHLCTCDSPALANGDGSTACKWKLSKETLFSEDPVEEHFGATLVYMGDRSNFCLIQRILIDVDEERNFYNSNSGEPAGSWRSLLRLTTFSLKFDKEGQLTTGNSRRVRYYKVPVVAAQEDPVAFWM